MAGHYDWSEIGAARAKGVPWRSLGDAYGVGEPTIRGAYSRWKARQGMSRGAHTAFSKTAPEPDGAGSGTFPDNLASDGQVEATRIFTRDEIARITSLEDLLAFFKVDTERWSVSHFRVNKWEQHSNKRGIVPLYQVRAVLVPKSPLTEDALREVFRQFLEDAKAHAPRYPWHPTESDFVGEEPVLFELAVFDPHIGMYAWGKETGAPYDTEIAVRDYSAAVEYLLGLTCHYSVEKILYVVGNDLFHVDTLGMDARGRTRGGATTSGTTQDVDTRLPRIFTAVRRAVVEGIDKARLVAPVEVLCVPGNHDEQTVYRLGEVLAAWYRNDDRVEVTYGPQKRFYHVYGRNLLGFTHGMEFKRKRDNLALIMATEAPEQWAATTHREWHVGHNHIAQELRYMEPAWTLSEGRAIRVRSLPGLTPEDAWHYTEGYKHRRAATALAFRRSGGVAGVHEFNL